MTQTGDSKGLVMTHGKEVYSFHCASSTNCYWKKEDYELKIKRTLHIMLTVPPSLVQTSDCELNANGVCRCPIGVVGDKCDQCKNMYWGLDQNGCKSKFLLFIIQPTSVLTKASV